MGRNILKISQSAKWQTREVYYPAAGRSFMVTVSYEF